ncbi:hypothetical protein DFH28DRAFT_1137904 [Melampsora americana]|nr:hypothetical protein DFH28DRAFT_1137904 [Melampsora americana]
MDDESMDDACEPFQSNLDQAMGFSNSNTSSFSTSSARQVGNLLLTPCSLAISEELPLDDEMDNMYDGNGDILTRMENSRIYDDLLSSQALKKIRSAIVNASISSWMYPSPSNLGSPSHGKLRSSDWVVLVTVHLTFVIFQLNNMGKISPKVAQNVLHLCSLCEIVMSYESSMAKIEQYFNHLTAYCAILQKL